MSWFPGGCPGVLREDTCFIRAQPTRLLVRTWDHRPILARPHRGSHQHKTCRRCWKDGTSFLSAKHGTASPIISPTSALFRSLRRVGPSVALPPRHSFPRCVRSRHLCRQQTSLLPRSKSSPSLPVKARRASDTTQARRGASAINIASVAST